MFALLLALFSVSATVLFGSTASGYDSVGKAYISLTRLIVSAEFSAYRTMEDIFPTVTPLFFLLFFFLLWLIVLNLVLGLVVSGFVTAKQKTIARLRNSELETMGEVLDLYFLMKGSLFKEERHLTKQNGVMSSSVAACSAALRTQLSWRNRFVKYFRYSHERYLAALAIGEEIRRRHYADDVLPRRDARQILYFVSEEQRTRWFDMVEARECTEVHQAEENTDALAYQLVEIGEKLEASCAVLRGERDEVDPELLESETESESEEDMEEAVTSGVLSKCSCIASMVGSLHRTSRLIIVKQDTKVLAHAL